MIITIIKLLMLFGIIIAVYCLGYFKGHEAEWCAGWNDCIDVFYGGDLSKYQHRKCVECPFYKTARIWLDEYDWSYGEHDKHVNKRDGDVNFDLLAIDLTKEIEDMGFTEDYEYDDSYRY